MSLKSTKSIAETGGKMIRLKIGMEAKSGFTVDIGLLHGIERIAGLRIGLVIQNLRKVFYNSSKQA